MSNNDIILSNKYYTVRNALSWGLCKEHYRRAYVQGPWEERIGHGVIALLEFLPIISQITSLFEIAIVRIQMRNSFLASLSGRNVHLHPAPKPQLPHLNRIIGPLSEPPSIARVDLPPNTKYLTDALFPLHRSIERQYLDLPWPEQLSKIIVVTKTANGSGDVVASAKAIALMQKMHPSLTFDWVIEGEMVSGCNPRSFLTDCDLSKVHIRSSRSLPLEKEPGHFLLTGPTGWSEYRIYRDIIGPTLSFLEFGLSNDTQILAVKHLRRIPEIQHREPGEVYSELHPWLFMSSSEGGMSSLPMGLRPGTGVFIDHSRVSAPLSRGYCCPSYLRQIQDEDLRYDILEAMHVDGQSEPDYEQYSFNSGYAHFLISWRNFIQCTALHERDKHVVIVLNQRCLSVDVSTENFQTQIFTEEFLKILKNYGYGTIILKGNQPKAIVLQQADNPQSERSLTVIIRPSFLPADMKNMQLASERLLTTGDNSAIEAWCSRCILYLYETHAHKSKFLQQQVDLAQTISPNLSRLLALFGGDERLGLCANQPLSAEKYAEMEVLLRDPDLSDATLQFCDTITAEHSFNKVLVGALKRAAWHHCIPEFEQMEAEVLGEDFRKRLVEYIFNSSRQTTLTVSTLPELRRRLREAVETFQA